MNSLQHISSILISLVIFVISHSASAAGGYQLNPGDQIEVSVWKEETLQREVLVLPDGTISFPLVGIINAAGKTADELRRLIIKRLKVYVPEAEVTVSILQTTGNKIFVIGKVTNPGAYALSGPVDIMQALSLAGGLDRFANEKRIKVLRRINGVQKAIPFNYSDVIDGENLQSNIVLRSGDLVVVP